MKDIITQYLLVFGGALFCIGLVGFLTRRSMILMFLSLEMMLSGVSVNLIAFSRHHANYQGQVLAIMVLTIAACEAAIALALIVSLYRHKHTLDIQAWDELSETIVSHPVEAPTLDVEHDLEFPTLTRSGLDPLEHPIPSKYDAQVGQVTETKTPRAKEISSHA